MCRGIAPIASGRDGGTGTLEAKNSGKAMLRRIAPTSRAREVAVGNNIMPAPEGLSGRAHGAMATYKSQMRSRAGRTKGETAYKLSIMQGTRQSLEIGLIPPMALLVGEPIRHKHAHRGRFPSQPSLKFGQHRPLAQNVDVELWGP